MLARTMKETNKLKSKLLSQWATYSATLQKVTQDSDEIVYQCQELKLFSETKMCYESKYTDYCSQVTECIRSRLEWSNLQLIRDVIVVLATQGCQKILDLDTVGVMEKFPFRFDTVPFCLRTVFHFIRFLTVYCFVPV